MARRPLRPQLKCEKVRRGIDFYWYHRFLQSFIQSSFTFSAELKRRQPWCRWRKAVAAGLHSLHLVLVCGSVLQTPTRGCHGACACLCVCSLLSRACVCVCERERERERLCLCL